MGPSDQGKRGPGMGGEAEDWPVQDERPHSEKLEDERRAGCGKEADLDPSPRGQGIFCERKNFNMGV